MTDTNVIKLAQPGTFTDSLTEILRNGARALLTQAVETEVADFLGQYADLKTETGRQRVVRHGHLPEREVMTGIGPVSVRQPRVRDREVAADDPDRIRFTPALLPPCSPTARTSTPAGSCPACSPSSATPAPPGGTQRSATARSTRSKLPGESMSELLPRRRRRHPRRLRP